MSEIRIETLGCRLNQIESESVARIFLDNGFSVSMEGVTSASAEDSQTLLSIINTCTVTQKAEQKARRLIRLILKKYPNAALVVTGCYAQLAGTQIEAIDKRICVLGGQVKSRLSLIPELLKNQKNKDWQAQVFATKIKESVVSTPVQKIGFPEESFKLSTSAFLSHSRASLKIQDGCNCNCSYCAIHIARGHSVSLDVQSAIERVQELESKGHDEVVLTTVNIGQYRGAYKDGFCDFSELLQLLLLNTKKIRFRISSLYPEIVNEKFCRVISDERVQPHFHISVQSGSDKILKLMNRQYKASDVEKACKMLKEAKANPFLACDIITGFPGETDADFEDTMKLCRACDFAWVHAFPYSERPGTVAASMKNKVPQSISGERAKELTQWAIAQKIKYVESFCEKELTAVLETARRPSALSPDNSAAFVIYHAVTENFIHCEIVSNAQSLENHSAKVKIKSVLSERIKKGGDIEAAAEFI
ncbi:MAG: tRNA (N(6)-L-threonylcarbamoyladenosine(37)-C(2))-methylthiotransferase MtaB [Treponema sp.]|nr:tRNA (N(6)-L-threonylcarbamoyladenosine(37)-C(2))-methylthiotransferase MtaB [Treponema sp.]